MNPSILNREFQHPADGWYHVEPRGEHPNQAAGVVQVIDDEAVSSIVNRFNGDADAGSLSHGAEMLIDHEHFSHEKDKETRAFGWLNRLQSRADGIYGRIRWSTTGKAAVDGGDYRFFSTEYEPEQCALLNREKTKLRPLVLAGLTLTNRPNNRGGKPITNALPATAATSAASAAGNQNQNQTPQMKNIATRLGLSAEASEEAILGELTKVLNRATEAEGKLPTVTTERDLLKNRVTELLAEQIDADLATAGITEEATIAKLKPVLVPMKNRAERVDFLSLMAKPATATAAATAKGPLTNRQAATVPGGKPGESADTKALDSRKAAIITNRAAQIQRDIPGVTTMGAFLQAQKQIDAEIASGVLVVK